MAKALDILMFFSPTLAKVLAILLVALVLVVRPGGLFVVGGALLVLFFPQGIMGAVRAKFAPWLP